MCKHLAALRAEIEARLSPYRFAHTLGVEEMAARLGQLYCPEAEEALRAAALLHDLTKELDTEAQLRLMAEHGVSLREDERRSPAIFHGITAALVIPREYPAYATDTVLSAVRWHTTGREGMSLTDALLYLADYIEEGRRFPDCVALRAAFFEAEPAKMPPEARLAHLRHILLRSLEMTLAGLEKEGREVCRDTEAAYRFLTQEKYPF